MINHEDSDPNYLSVSQAEVSIDEKLWHGINKLADLIGHTLVYILDDQEEISILLTSDEHIQQLNSDFRGKDKPRGRQGASKEQVAAQPVTPVTYFGQKF